MNALLTESGYTLDGKWRLVPVELEDGHAAEMVMPADKDIYRDAINTAPPPPHQSPSPDCRTCANRGHINGISQETYCDSCMWYGAYWKKNHYNPIPETAP